MNKQLENLLQSEIDPAFAKRARFIFESVEKYRPARVLDAGCGRGFYSHSLSFFAFIKEIHGFDINEDYLSIAKNHCEDRRIKLQKGDIYNLPYKDSYFDCIILSEILEHLVDEKKALNELKRVLKPKGLLIITVPSFDFPFLWDPLNWVLMKVFRIHINKNIWWLAGMWADHVRLYTFDQLQKVVKQNGFRIEKSEKFVSHGWPFSHFLLYGIGKNIVARLGGKEFDRFSFKKKPISPLLAKIVGLPSRVFDNSTDEKWVDFAVIVTKK